jgi:hypothetical protein
MSKSLLHKLGACKEGLEWARGKSWHEQWDTCENSGWMLWALDKLGYSNHPVLGRYACDCARYTPIGDGKTVQDRMTDASSRNAVSVAENYLDGRATIEELQRARYCVERAEEEAYSHYLACRVPNELIPYSAALMANFVTTYVADIANRSSNVSCVVNAAYVSARAAYNAAILADSYLLALYHAALVADPNAKAFLSVDPSASVAYIATRKWQSYRLRELIPWTEVKELIANYMGRE